MAWLATLDTKAHRWPWPLFWAFRGLMGFLALLGAWLWITLWYERWAPAGIAQFVLCAWVFWKELMAPAPSASPAKPTPPPAF